MPAKTTTRTPSRHLKCMEIWGGNRAVDRAIAVTGIDAWVVSQPHGGDAAGGDVHFVSTCGAGKIARFALADVAGHGLSASDLGVKLRRLMRKHINSLDQTRFARDLNKEFGVLSTNKVFATALLASYYAPTDHLIICNAGHPAPLWYRQSSGTWEALKRDMPGRAREVANLPLGIIEPTNYYQFAVQLEPGDLILVYSDAAIEAGNRTGELLGVDGLRRCVAAIDTARPDKFCHALLDVLETHRAGAPPDDDVTLVLLRHNGDRPPRQSLGEMIKVMGKMFGLVKT